MLEIIVIFYILIQLTTSNYSSQVIKEVYSPLMKSQLSSNDYLWTPLSVRVAVDVDLVFVSCGFRGINIINQSGDKILFAQDLDSNYVQSFESTSDGQYLFVVISQNLYTYHLDFQIKDQSKFMMQNFALLQNITFTKNILTTTYNQNKELLILAVRGGDIFVYDMTVKNQIEQISTFNTDSVMVNSVFLSNDGNWLYLANDVKGFQLLNLYETLPRDQKARQIKIEIAGQGTFGLRPYQAIATKDNQFIYAFDFWYGFFYANCSEIVRGNSEKYPMQISFTYFWPFQNMQTTCQVMTMNSDETFLFLGVRSQGILIFDIRQKDNIHIFEVIKIDTLFYSIQLSKNENYLYFSSSNSVFTYTKDLPNLNEDLPNLFNTHQIKYQNFLDYSYKWRCYVDQVDEYFFGGFASDGLYIFPFDKDPYKLDVHNFTYYDIQLNSFYFEKQNKYLVIPRYYSQESIGIYQYKPLNDTPQEKNVSLQNMKLIKNYYIEDYQISEGITFSSDSKYAVQTYMIGLIIYNSTDIFNLTILSRWNNLDFMQGENQGACFTRDNKWIYSTIRLFGVYLLNVQDKKNPILADYVATHGGENVLMSQLFDQYIYLIDGFKGFGIIDTSFAPNLEIIAKVQLTGYSVDALLLNQEQYILITSMGKGFLTLIDIRNKNYPQIVNQISYENQYGFALCAPHTTQYIFITSSDGIIVLPTHSQVQIHTHVSQIHFNAINGQQYLTKLSKSYMMASEHNQVQNQEYIFQVGQKIQLNFAILYPIDQNILINNVYYYFNGENQPIPSFFTFNKFQQSLQFFVDKSLINSSISMDYPNLNTILLQALIPLNTESFIYYQTPDSNDKSSTNITQSQLIYSYLQEKNIIDINGILSDEYDFAKPLYLDQQFCSQLLDPSTIKEENYSEIIEQINWKIQQTLMRSFYINPIKFYVETSLFFDKKNPSQFIKSNSQNAISITLSIESEDGKLIFNTNPSVVFQLSDSQNQLIIQGSIENVNKVLQSKIIFANNTQITTQNSPNITITIQDDINYPLIKQYRINESQFIALKQQLKVNHENNLQNQINKQFQEGEVYIEYDIAFTFQKDSFIVSDAQDLTYQYFYLSSSNEYKQIPLNFWLQQSDNSQLSFKGSTTSSMFQNSYTFKIIASDRYTSAEDQFVLKVNRIPLFYLLNLLLKIIGPLVFFIGLLQQRSIFLNAIFKNRVTFAVEVAVCGEHYMKQIIIQGQSHKYSEQILLQLINKVQNDNNLDIQQQLNEKKKCNNIQFQANDDKFLDKALQIQTDEDNNDLKHFFTGHNNFIQIKLIQNLQKIKVRDQLFPIEKKYLDQKGNLLMSRVIKDILDHNIKVNQNERQNFEIDIQNTDSKIYRALRAQLSRYLLNLDQRSLIVYNYIKQFCSNNNQYTLNDWFKVIAKIEFQVDDEMNLNNQSYKQQKLFPKLELKIYILSKILQYLNLFPQQQKINPNTFDQLLKLCAHYQTNINLYLIREVIFADVIGYTGEKPSIFKVAFGQSLHTESENVKQIFACKKKEMSKWLRPLYKIFNLEYSLYGISKNMRLPTWLYLDQKNGVIILNGTPEQDDIEEILIRISDNTGYVIKQFILKIVKNENKPIQNDNVDQIYEVADENNYKNESIQQFKFQNKQIHNIQRNLHNNVLYNAKKLYELKTLQNQDLSDYSLNSYQQSPSRMKEYQFINKQNSKNYCNLNAYSLNLSEDQHFQLSHTINYNKLDLSISEFSQNPKNLQNTVIITADNKVVESESQNTNNIDEVNE